MIDRLIRLLERIPHSNGGKNYPRALRTWSWCDGDVTLMLLFEPRDLWSGWYWDKTIEGEFVQWAVATDIPPPGRSWGYRSYHSNCRVYTLYRSVLPTLVLRLRWKDRRAVKAMVAKTPRARYLNYRQGIMLARVLERDAIERQEEQAELRRRARKEKADG